MTTTDLRHDARQDGQGGQVNVETKICACGCGQTFTPRKGKGRPRDYVAEHRKDLWNRANPRVKVDQLPLPLPPPSRFEDVPAKPTFLGPGYEPAKDRRRLKRHCEVVLGFLRRCPEEWFTYAALAHATGIPEGSIRTRCSNLRKWGHPIETRQIRADRFAEVRWVEQP